MKSKAFFRKMIYVELMFQDINLQKNYYLRSFYTKLENAEIEKTYVVTYAFTCSGSVVYW